LWTPLVADEALEQRVQACGGSPRGPVLELQLLHGEDVDVELGDPGGRWRRGDTHGRRRRRSCAGSTPPRPRRGAPRRRHPLRRPAPHHPASASSGVADLRVDQVRVFRRRALRGRGPGRRRRPGRARREPARARRAARWSRRSEPFVMSCSTPHHTQPAAAASTWPRWPARQFESTAPFRISSTHVRTWRGTVRRGRRPWAWRRISNAKRFVAPARA